jgi:hypothetical protein
MATTAQARTPVHLWIVGIVSLLWACFGCLDYTMTNLKNPSWMAQMTPDQIAYMATLPSWLTGFWALGVWGALAGSVLLLMRSRYAVWAYAVSFVGALVGLGYQMVIATMPTSMKAGAMGMMPIFIILFAAFLLWYAMNAQKKGVIG